MCSVLKYSIANLLNACTITMSIVFVVTILSPGICLKAKGSY